MEKNCKKEQMFSGGGTDHPVFREREWYRGKIVDIVNQIGDIWILEQIHKFAINMTKEGS